MLKNIFFALGTLAVIALAWQYLPFHAPYTVTVTGTAQADVANQIATFNATVASTNADKQTAINNVNSQITSLINSLKNFGIADNDLKTESVSVYQAPTAVPNIQIYPPVPAPSGNNDWTASNSLTITLRDTSKVSDLSTLLNNSGATNIYGPNFTVNADQTLTQANLLSQALANAKTKAQAIAKASGETLGKVINVQEENSSGIFPLAVKSAGNNTQTPVEAGTTNQSQTITVVFELK